MEWNPWLYTPLFGMALIKGAMCISGTKDLFVFDPDKQSGPQSLFIVIQALGIIANEFHAWKTFWWNGLKLYVCVCEREKIYSICLFLSNLSH